MAESALSRVPPAVKVIIFFVVLLATGAIYFGLWYMDVRSQIAAQGRQEEQLRADLAKARKDEFAYQKDLQELTDRQQRQRELNKILPKTTEYPSFLSSIQNVANVAGVSLAAWTPQSEVPEEFYARVPMKVELSGRYHQIAKFFYQVGQLERIINIENIAVLEPTQEGDEFILKVEALATAFHAVEGKAAPPPGARKRRRKKK